MTLNSSQSWSSARGGDIIDLDRYMRGGGGARTGHRTEITCERLVVDAGATIPRPGATPSESSITPPSLPSLSSRSREARRPEPRKPTERRSEDPRRSRDGSRYRGSTRRSEVARHLIRETHDKRFSHDSGLSDHSYLKRREKSRRLLSSRSPALGNDVEAEAIRTLRETCERVLNEQQAQISRVAQMCERLTTDQRQPKKGQLHQSESTSSSLSSSTETDDRRRTDVHLSSECKTYKIIMTKLDELNRVFAARRLAPATPAAPLAAPLVAVRNARCVDKTVATENVACGGYTQNKVTCSTSRRRFVEKGVGSFCDEYQGDSFRGNEYARPHCESSCFETDTSQYMDHCDFDLENPVNLYAQAKRLQALPTTSTRRARSVECPPRAYTASCSRECSPECSREHAFGEVSICRLCRSYWKCFRRCIVTQLSKLE